MKLFIRLSFIITALCAASMTQAFAKPQFVAIHKDWSVYKLDLGSDQVCFAITEPQSKSPKSVKHGDVFFMVSSWKSGVAKNQPSLKAGYTLRDEPNPIIRVGSDKWDMYTSDDEAFVEKSGQEQRLISAMRRGATMRVGATSKRGTSTSYVFSLQGISAALDRAAKECR